MLILAVGESVYDPVSPLCGVFDVICELFIEVFFFVCYCCFVIESDGDVRRLWRCFVC